MAAGKTMGYKRDGKKLLRDETEWAEWRREHAELIEASGLPELVVSDEDHWYDFLDHGHLGHYEDPLNFSLDQLTARQKAFCLSLVMTTAWGLNSIAGRTLIGNLIDAVKDRYREQYNVADTHTENGSSPPGLG